VDMIWVNGLMVIVVFSIFGEPMIGRIHYLRHRLGGVTKILNRLRSDIEEEQRFLIEVPGRGMIIPFAVVVQ
jgi:hypothetical protein